MVGRELEYGHIGRFLSYDFFEGGDGSYRVVYLFVRYVKPLFAVHTECCLIYFVEKIKAELVLQCSAVKHHNPGTRGKGGEGHANKTRPWGGRGRKEGFGG